MDKIQYLEDPFVQDFSAWLALKLEAPDSFRHAYINREDYETWECNSLYDAALKYSWFYSFTHPLNGKVKEGRTLSDSIEFMREMRVLLRDSLYSGDSEKCQKVCSAITEWGGIKTPPKALVVMDDRLCEYLARVSIALDTNKYKLKSMPRFVRMSGSFAKIYAVLLDDYVIYDSRLSAGLCLLVHKFCEEKVLARIPASLAFGLIAHRGPTNRDPSTGRLSFGTVTDPLGHLDNSMQASWLLGAVLSNQKKKFSSFATEQQSVLAAALFMIGYEVPGIS